MTSRESDEMDENTELTFEMLLDACRPGGASNLVVTTELEAAAGPHAGIAPARYVRGLKGTYAYEPRWIDGGIQRCVVVESKGGFNNKVEDALGTAILDGDGPLRFTPRMRITYENGSSMTDYEAPHRAFDGHFRAGTIDGKFVTKDPRYRELRDCTAVDMRPLLETSPVSLLFGAWDSSRKAHQVRVRSAMTGEIIGVLADQDPNHETPLRGAARVDPMVAGVQLSVDEMKNLVGQQEDDLSEKIIEEKNKAKNGTFSGSKFGLGLGALPPSLKILGFVSCKRIIRSTVLSFSALRQLRFGATAEANVACRALLAAMGLASLARSNEELVVRANCDLRESEEPRYELDCRNGKIMTLLPVLRDQADALLEQAIDLARELAGVSWNGEEFTVVGNPIVINGATAEAEDD